MPQTPLAVIQAVLEAEDFPTQLLPISEDVLVERLLVGLFRDDQDRDYALQMAFINDVNAALGEASEEDEAFLLQFMLIYPFQIRETLLSDAARFLHHLNRFLPIGAFGLSEQDRAAYFSYTLACKERAVEETVLLEVVQMINTFVQMFGPYIEALAQGAQTRETIIATLASQGLQAPPLLGSAP